ncbi:stage II sporulation protein M [Candidatus Formimonas warabiya]|uniref:Stage II sporulation protein M n=1 Tax=Formimonas warabiya TaxID=1761012 RepID=A0A3G1KNM9_FORW1|nr:stage II sporulation protein M [Candidatus Formimonas warabiya]ATW24073.1 stage II sporulation protein M [Candidatus Formimonas warabiya]
MAGTLKALIAKNLQENLVIYLIIPVIFLCGVFFGTLGVKELNSSQVKELVDFVDGFINNLPTAAVNASLETRHALTVNLKTLFYIWLLGLMVIGIPLTMIIVFTRGFIFGFTVSFLIEQKLFQGILVVLLTVLPQNVLFIPVILVAAVFSISFSLFVVKGKFAGKTLNLSKKFVSYTLTFVVLGLFVVLASFIQGYVSPSLVKAVFYFS